MLITSESEYQYYDQGWNARCRGEAYREDATRDWRDGWSDCNEFWDGNLKELE